jgi:hypothetical protein
MVDILYVIVRSLLDSCARCEAERKESAETMRILLVHGIGRSDIDPNYYHPWEPAISTGLSKAGLGASPEYVEFHYDDAVEKHDRGAHVYAAAVIELVRAASSQPARLTPRSRTLQEHFYLTNKINQQLKL